LKCEKRIVTSRCIPALYHGGARAASWRSSLRELAETSHELR
jgi:hypothetical protein